MKHTVWVGALCCALVGLVTAPGGAAEVLYMYQPSNPLLDDQLVEFFESLGHNVTLFDTGAHTPEEQVDAAELADVVYITESIGSATVHDGLETYIKEVATPQIWAEAFAFDEAALTGDIQYEDFGNVPRDVIEENPLAELEDPMDSLRIVDSQHPLAAGLTGTVQVYNEPYSLNFGLIETLGAGADVIAVADSEGKYATLWAYEPGAELEDGTRAAGLRIGNWLSQGSGANVLLVAPEFDNIHANGLKLLEAAINYAIAPPVVGTPLQAGDADQDLDFDQLDLVKVQVASKYLTGQAATWGEGDWNGAPGGSPGSPPPGNGLFDQLDIIAALNAGKYLTGPYAALGGGGGRGDGQTSIVYYEGTGEVSVDAPAGKELTSINIESASGIFTAAPAQNLGGSFDNDADTNIFKATFGSSFGSLSFGNVAQPNLTADMLANDLTVVGSLAGGGSLGDVDLIYIPIPEPAAAVLLVLGLVAGCVVVRRRGRA